MVPVLLCVFLRVRTRRFTRKCELSVRVRVTARSRPVERLGPILGDIFNQPKLILNGLDLNIKLTRDKDAFCLLFADAEPFKVQILQAALYVKRV